MNINDIPTDQLFEAAKTHFGTDDSFEIIFARQRELMEKYLPIESELLGRPLLSVPVDIHSAVGQAAIKERAWWFTEELAEALEAIDQDAPTKALEEMSDAIHFLTEAMILSNIRFSENSHIEVPWSFWHANISLPMNRQLRPQILAVITELGLAMWQLRNKSWKRTQIPTDFPRFETKLVRTYTMFVEVLQTYWRLSFKDIAVLYLRKAAVNQFRIRSNY